MLEHFLAGPILRRTTQNRICVWLALDEPLELSLEILAKDGKTVVGASKPEQLEDSRITLGDKLHVYLLRAYPPPDAEGRKTLFKTGVPLHYRLLDGNGKPLDLKKAGLTYKGHQYPVFHVPAALSSVLHGSCRKPHGDRNLDHRKAEKDACLKKVWRSLLEFLGRKKKEPGISQVVDALSIGDGLLEQYYQGELGSRPDLLLLTGDQIYADDVAASLLQVLRDKAKDLVGGEAIPLREDADANAEKCLRLWLRWQAKALTNAALDWVGWKTDAPPQGSSFDPSALKLGARMEFLRACGAGFTSTEAHNHLMSFGEFAAMYLYAFGNAQGWVTPVWADLPADHVKLEKEKTRLKILQNSKAIAEFGATLPKVRRLLANIPTYMIFDDHDVTDDWNITGHWYDKVRSSPTGRRIVSNALAAYWAFQGWGNDPDNFDADMVESITRHLADKADPALGERYDLFTWKHRGWGFSVPTDPPVIAMDSRTQRQPDNPFYPPRLLDRYALDWLRVEWTKLKTPKPAADGNSLAITAQTRPFFIATTPVLGFAPVEGVVQFLLWAVGYVEDLSPVRMVEEAFDKRGWLTGWVVDTLDAEAWTANLDGLTGLLDTISHKMEISQCTFLSGDVHYAFTAVGQYRSSSAHSCAMKALDCCQLNSSALRNKPSDGQVKALGKMEKESNSKKGNWWRFYAGQWRLEHKLLPDGGGQKVEELSNLGQVLLAQGQPTQHLLWVAPGVSRQYLIPLPSPVVPPAPAVAQPAADGGN